MSNAVIPMLSHRWPLLLGAALVLCLAGCGGGGDSGTTGSQCGNGRINANEQCDDGNSVDTDACTAVCRDARCGDGAIQSGVEVCDGTNLGTSANRCTDLGYGLGENGRPLPGCLADCSAFDVSFCGPQSTPTPLRPTATPTFTPTPMPSTTCGDHLLEAGETCDTCPDDCIAAACLPSGETVTFTLTVAGSRAPHQGSVQLAYRTDVLGIPGSGNDITVRQRVRAAPPLTTNFTVADLDYALDVQRTGTQALPTPFASARFDTCAGAPPATLDDLSCVVLSCTDASGAVPNCRCVVAPQTQP